MVAGAALHHVQVDKSPTLALIPNHLARGAVGPCKERRARSLEHTVDRRSSHPELEGDAAWPSAKLTMQPKDSLHDGIAGTLLEVLRTARTVSQPRIAPFPGSDGQLGHGTS